MLESCWDIIIIFLVGEEETTKNMIKEKSELFKLIQMMTGFSLSYVLFAAVDLGIIEMIYKKPSSLKKISDVLMINEKLLGRFLRVLEAAEILRKENNKYKVSSMGQYMAKDHSGSIRDSMMMCANEGLASWSNLTKGLKTNFVPFYLNYGCMPFNLHAKNSQMAERFNQSMISSSKREKINILFQKYDFSDVKKIIDIGGGYGIITIQILKKYKKIEATIYDLPYLKKGVEKYILKEKLEKRCKFVPGNFFNSIPSGGDLYILSRVLHDWDDIKASKILQNCKKVINDSNLLVIEKVISSKKDRNNLKLALDDLNVWVMCGGEERTLNDFKLLFNKNCLELNKVVMINSDKVVLEVKRSNALY